MANGKTHFIHNLVCAGAITGIGLYYNLPLELLTIGNIAGIIFTPDIDIESKTYTEAKLAHVISKGFSTKKAKQNKIGRLIASFIQMITAPYAFLIPHRSWLSHLPPFSVITQLLYFYLVYFVFCKVFDLDFVHYSQLMQSQTELIIISSVLFIHHLAHLLGDGALIIFGGKKRYLLGYWFYLLTTKLFPQGKD